MFWGGLLPYLLIGGALLITGAFLALSNLTAAVVTEVLVAMGTIWLVVMLVLVIVSHVCMNISPVERFTDISDQAFLDDVAKAEADICSMLEDVSQFITNTFGKRGQDNPALPAAAFQAALAAANGPTTVCPPATMVDAEDRLDRMERTLLLVIEPQFKTTYDTSVTCNEGFADLSLTPVDRLQRLRATIDLMNSKYLRPIQQKQKDLQSGRVSDCDKKKGAKTAITPTR